MMTSKDKDMVVLSIRIPAELKYRLEAQAKRVSDTMRSIAIQAIDEFVEDMEAAAYAEGRAMAIHEGIWIGDLHLIEEENNGNS